MADSNGGGGRDNNPGNFANDREKAPRPVIKVARPAAATSRTTPSVRPKPAPRAASTATAAAEVVGGAHLGAPPFLRFNAFLAACRPDRRRCLPRPIGIFDPVPRRSLMAG